VAAVDDVADSPTLLAARERHLQACLAAPFWNPPWRKPRFEAPKGRPAAERAPRAPQTGFRDEFRDALAVAVDRALKDVLAERAIEREMIDSRQPMPNNYWLKRRAAEQRLRAATLMMEATFE